MKEISVTLYNQNIWNSTPVNRPSLIRDLILEWDADVCCMQECGPRTMRAGENPIGKLLEPRYAEVPTEVGDLNYTPIFYRKERFLLVDSGYILYEGKNDVNSKSITWAIFEETESKVQFGICSTHFWWKYDSEEDNQWRLANAARLFTCMEELRTRYDIPVIAGGDLNCGVASEQGEEPWRWLCERLMDARAVAPETTDMLTHHAYPIKDENGLYVDADKPCRTLDHVFVTEHPCVRVDSFVIDDSKKARYPHRRAATPSTTLTTMGTVTVSRPCLV